MSLRAPFTSAPLYIRMPDHNKFYFVTGDFRRRPQHAQRWLQVCWRNRKHLTATPELLYSSWRRISYQP
ncbi:hypothetical protein KCP75_25095 [Salmonella enterica subsp. enterica]|nr:hypothetical protein KCP75_25095 [Salmonella enterica subsp. enterica]